MVDIAGQLLIFEAPGKRSAVYQDLPILSPTAPIDAIGSDQGALPVEAFCERYRLGPEQILRLVRKGDLPKVYEHYHKLMMPLRSVRTSEMGKRPEFTGVEA